MSLASCCPESLFVGQIHAYEWSWRDKFLLSAERIRSQRKVPFMDSYFEKRFERF
jgi:hypothetical protein